MIQLAPAVGVVPAAFGALCGSSSWRSGRRTIERQFLQRDRRGLVVAIAARARTVATDTDDQVTGCEIADRVSPRRRYHKCPWHATNTSAQNEAGKKATNHHEPSRLISIPR